MCSVLITSLLTYGITTSLLSPYRQPNAELEEDAERFRSYQVRLPGVTYDDIERQFYNITWDSSKWVFPEKQPNASDPEPDPTQAPIKLTANCTINDSYSELSKQLNTYLYQIAIQTCGDLYCGDIKLSPLLPLAEANQEGGRVNTAVTFSALASSSIFTFNSVEELANLNVTDCLRDANTWQRMSSEYYTRDRGALQCNPNYSGDMHDFGPSERELLDAYVAENGIPDYGVNMDSLGNSYTVADWINYSRTKQGDRFNPQSMLKMFAWEKQNVEIPGILRHFPDVQNEWQVYCIMAYCHWCGSGFLTFDRDMAYAGWNSVSLADEYCRDLTKPECIEVIYAQCLQDIQAARAAGRNPVRCLDKRSGRAVFDILVSEGLVKPYEYYFRDKVNSKNNWNQGATACTYPIGIIYGVMQMNLLYSGY